MGVAIKEIGILVVLDISCTLPDYPRQHPIVQVVTQYYSFTRYCQWEKLRKGYMGSFSIFCHNCM